MTTRFPWLVLLGVLVGCQRVDRSQAGASQPNPDSTKAAPARIPVRADPLVPDDFTLVGIPLDADAAWIVRSFGRPDSITSVAHPFVAAMTFPQWHYGEYDVLLTTTDAVVALNVRASRFRTRRGIGVGSTAAEVLAAYGAPSDGGRPNGVWQYDDPRQDLHYLAFRLVDGRVIEVSFGYILD